MCALRVLVADDHCLFRQGLISLMNTRPDFLEVVGEAKDGEQAILQARQLKPDLILMDVLMPGGNGLDATEIICREFPDMQVVMLTASDEDEHLLRAIQNGARGYLLKSMRAEELFELILGVAQGEVAMTRTVGGRLIKLMSRQADVQQETAQPLTEREREVLNLVVMGDSNPQIAARLGVSVNTVKSHVSHILNKLDLDNRTQMTAYALQNPGIVG